MAEFHLEFLPAAMDDLDRIADYYLRVVGASAAEQITDQILETLEHLEQYPYLGASHPDPVLASMEYRKIVSGNYVCVYKVIGHAIVVYRIVHGATDYPKYFY
ncbi:MAG: type II toxin-antitoxin system RelE/ParE family toxin [Oscillospiraceae bacterium]|nr:type II toxin-antitoxin system RelE/ParE family toxin [Oscillospiraceae bacterium]MCR4935290.1 type II toxin-antitoxin system RelE/ParE family toxin [Oscillospiraceae bacterium]